MWFRDLRFITLVSMLSACAVGCTRGEPSTATAAVEIVRGGKIVLGSPSLTAGIPGEGPLQLSDVKKWLANPRNHEPLDFVLPAGLHDAQSLIDVAEGETLTRAKIELGRQLFFDRRLSRDDTFSCSTCHLPQQAYSAHLIMPEIGRSVSVSFNRIFSREQFWDGRAESLATQPKSPLMNKFEMNTTVDSCENRLNGIEGYRIQFEKIYGGVSFDAVGLALAAFQRALVTGCSSWDAKRGLEEFAKRDESELSTEEVEIRNELRRVLADRPMSDAARRGEAIFFSDRAKCGHCHSGPNLTDEDYHNLGVGIREEEPDLGRYHVTLEKKDLGVFKTPTLRNVADSGPYMHNGEMETLEEVVSYFVTGGRANENLDPLVEPIDLAQDEREDLVEFLRALSGPLPDVETERLPQ